MKDTVILPADALAAVEDTALFYPCSGNDWQAPIRLFAPAVTAFWFVDRAYFPLSRPADTARPLLHRWPGYEFLEKHLRGPAGAEVQYRVDPITGKRYPDLEPCVLTERYRHRRSGRVIAVHRRRGYGFSAFRKEITTLGVFFYRGDSQCEGGSGELWLKRDHVQEVCATLVAGGLFETDGSNHLRSREYTELWRLNTAGRDLSPAELVQAARPFTDRTGRRFTCVGVTDDRHGFALIWQVRRPTAAPEC